MPTSKSNDRAETAHELITANYAGDPVVKELYDRKHLVVPLVLIREGVLNGSQGPLFYPREELEASVRNWNYMPLVLYHPSSGGSARDPEVLNATQIGQVFNARYEDGSLLAEGWFDIARLRKIDATTLNRLQSGGQVELSTGLGTEQIVSRGTFNGKEYRAIARNYRADHVAVLPDQVGACSLKDGCGVNVANQKSFDAIRASLQEQLGTVFGPKDEERYVVEVFPDYFIMSKQGKLWQMNYSVEDDVVKILDNTPVEVQLTTDYVPVVSDATTNSNEGMKMTLAKKKREEIIDTLISNCDCWEEDDRETLNAASDSKLETLYEQHLKVKKQEAVVNAARKGFSDGNRQYTYNEETGEFVGSDVAPDPPNERETEVTNEAKPKSLEEWMAEAPAEVRQVVANAQEQERQAKEECITVITANELNQFKAEELREMPLPTLRKMTVIAVKKEDRKPSYAGAATPSGTTTNRNEEKVEGLALPVMNFENSELAKALGN